MSILCRECRVGFGLVAIALVASPSVYAVGRFSAVESSHSIFVGAGMMFQDSSRTATTDTGGTSLTSNSIVSFALAGRFKFSESWGFSPVISYTPFGAAGADTGEKTRLLTFDVRLFREIGFLDLHLGPGILWDTVSGSGGTATLNNGTSTTVFGLPGSASTSRFFYWDGGIGIKVSRLRADLDLLVTDTFTSRRAVYPAFTLSLGLF